MNETPDLPSPTPSAPSPKPAIAVLTVAVLVLGISTIVLWSRLAGQQPPPAIDLSRIAALEERVNALPYGALAARLQTVEQRLASEPSAIDGRLKALEERPPADIDALRQRIEGLEQQRVSDPVAQQARVAALEQKSTSDAATLSARIEAAETATVRDLSAALARITELERKALEQQRTQTARLEALERRPIADLTAIQDHLARLDQRPTADPRTPERLDALSGRLDGQVARAAALDTRMGKVEAAADELGRLARRAERLARLRQAEEALAAGQKLGSLPDAPPALARFADLAPPTEVGLRLAFPAVERAVRAASRSDSADASWTDRMWDRVQGLVTVRQGDRVVIGDSAVGLLARAQIALDAGDLAGAVTALAGLTGDAAKAAEPWSSDARALLEARAALTALAVRN